MASDSKRRTFPGAHLPMCAAAGLAAMVCIPLTMAHAADAALSASETGARYGQALGVIDVCIGSTLTDRAKTLEAQFSGDNLMAFRAQAAKVFDAWRAVRGCARPDDPNQCKIMMDASCAAAWREIGPSGTAIPGLVNFPTR